MIPDIALENYLCAHIQAQNFESSRTQILPANAVDSMPLTLPRVIVACASGSDPVMAQAGVFPVEVTATLLFNAREQEELYLLEPLQEAVTEALRCPGIVSGETNPASYYGVAIYGATLGAITPQQADDRIEVQVQATIHARRI